MRLFLGLMLSVVLIGCSGDSGSGDNPANFDRTAMMTNWADNLIIPSFNAYKQQVEELDAKVNSFTVSTNWSFLELAREAWVDAYRSYQYVGIYDSPKASELHLIESSNTYPTDVAGIQSNITTGNYNLAQPAQYAREGFPALDYMLYGVADDLESIVAYYNDHPEAKTYLKALTAHLVTVANGILDDWNNGYRETFIAGIGTSVSAPINQTVNNFVKNLEKDVRTPKLGIPAGLFSNGVTFTDKVEGYYCNNISRMLLAESLRASQAFFVGKKYASPETGPSLKSYLDAVGAERNGQPLSTIIELQYSDAINTAESTLNESFSQQILTDNAKMVDVYNKVQQIVVYEKLDMLQALNISIDYVDGDGD